MHWHDYLAFTVFAAASAYVVLRACRAIFTRRISGCAAACGSCRHSQPATSQPTKLLSIDASRNE
jgi:hypothetical protein